MLNKTSEFKSELRILALCLVAVVLSAILPPVVFAADNSASDRIIVSLGDSYSSGEGITPFYGQAAQLAEKVKDYDWLAHRSQNSWPGMLTLKSGDEEILMNENRGTHWYFAAASGATTKHLLEEQYKTYSKRDGLTMYKSNGKGTPLPPQLDVFAELDTQNKKADYVTLTLGGNDADFAGIVTNVVAGSTYLDLSYLSRKINLTWLEFYREYGIADKLRSSYHEIAQKAGEQAHIIVAGYPRLLDSEGRGFFISKDEATLVNTAVSNFNDAIQHIVNECRDSGMNISFVSVEDAFEGHEAYTEPGTAFINEVFLGTKTEDLKDVDVCSAYSMHPNLNGAKAYAKCVQEKIDELEQEKQQANEETSSLSIDELYLRSVLAAVSSTEFQSSEDLSGPKAVSIIREMIDIGYGTYDTAEYIPYEIDNQANYVVSKEAFSSALKAVLGQSYNDTQIAEFLENTPYLVSTSDDSLTLTHNNGRGKYHEIIIDNIDMNGEQLVVDYTKLYYSQEASSSRASGNRDLAEVSFRGTAAFISNSNSDYPYRVASNIHLISEAENTAVVSSKYIINVNSSAYFRSSPEEIEENIICTIPLNTVVGFIETTSDTFSRVKYGDQYGFVKTCYLGDEPELAPLAELKNLYADLLCDYRDMALRFQLTDLNGDDIPELLVAGWYHVAGVIIYTYYDGTIAEVGTCGSFGMISYGETSKTIQSTYEGMGMISHRFFQIKNGVLEETHSASCNSYMDESIPAEYRVDNQTVNETEYNLFIAQMTESETFYKVGFDTGWEITDANISALRTDPKAFINEGTIKE